MARLTTIQISEDLRRRLKVLSSYRDVSYNELLGDLIEVFTSSIPFRSKEEFKEWFERNIERFGFKEILRKRERGFPDFTLRDEMGNAQEVELELIGEDFERHGYDPGKTDLIVCAFTSRDEVKGVPVLSIIKPPKKREEVIRRLEGRFTSVSIPTSLFKRIEQRIRDTGFTSVSGFVAYVLREIIAKEEKMEKPFTEEDEERVKEKLRALGYL
ncbi:MAG: ribbon-helix-helix domain-containing protein [Candidatus Bathyarchaeia archaeon]